MTLPTTSDTEHGTSPPSATPEGDLPAPPPTASNGAIDEGVAFEGDDIAREILNHGNEECMPALPGPDAFPWERFEGLLAHRTLLPRHASLTAQAGRDMIVIDGDCLVAAALRRREFERRDGLRGAWTAIEELQTLAVVHDIERLLAGLAANGQQHRVCIVEGVRAHWLPAFRAVRDVALGHLCSISDLVSVDHVRVLQFVKGEGATATATSKGPASHTFDTYEAYLGFQRASFALIDFLWEGDDFEGAPFGDGLKAHATAVAASCLCANIPVVDIVGGDGGLLFLAHGDCTSYLVRAPYLPDVREECRKVRDGAIEYIAQLEALPFPRWVPTTTVSSDSLATEYALSVSATVHALSGHATGASAADVATVAVLHMLSLAASTALPLTARAQSRGTGGDALRSEALVAYAGALGMALEELAPRRSVADILDGRLISAIAKRVHAATGAPPTLSVETGPLEATVARALLGAESAQVACVQSVVRSIEAVTRALLSGGPSAVDVWKGTVARVLTAASHVSAATLQDDDASSSEFTNDADLLTGNEWAVFRRAFGGAAGEAVPTPVRPAEPTFDAEYHYHTGELLDLPDALDKDASQCLFGDPRGPPPKWVTDRGAQRAATAHRDRTESLAGSAGGNPVTITVRSKTDPAPQAPIVEQLELRLKQAREAVEEVENDPERALQQCGHHGPVRLKRLLAPFSQEWEKVQLKSAKASKQKGDAKVKQIAALRDEWRVVRMRGFLAIAEIHALRLKRALESTTIHAAADALDCGWRLLAQLRRVAEMEPTLRDMVGDDGKKASKLQRRLLKALIEPLRTAAAALSSFTTFTSAVDGEIKRLLGGLKVEEKGKEVKSKSKATALACLDDEDMEEAEFQLRHMPDRLLRPQGVRDSRTAHARTPFKPDEWQVRLLNAVDANRSCLAIAPTSSGKTFICYYAMEKVLREDNDGVVVYVAPTKQLVSQVDNAICERFSKAYGGKDAATAMVGVFTRDFRRNERTCQILVTVPACAEIMFLSDGSEAKGRRGEWPRRVRYLIVDEVHNIGEGDGALWERLLLLADCPVIALSATIGNPSTFHAWLEHAQRSKKAAVAMSAGASAPSSSSRAPSSQALFARWNDTDDEEEERWMRVVKSEAKAPAVPERELKGGTARRGNSGSQESASSLVEMIEHDERFNDLLFSVWDATNNETLPFNPLCALSARSLASMGHIPKGLPRLTPEAALQLHHALSRAVSSAVKRQGDKVDDAVAKARNMLVALKPQTHFASVGADPISMREAQEYASQILGVLLDLAKSAFDIADDALRRILAPVEAALSATRAEWGFLDVAVALRQAVPKAIHVLGTQKKLPAIVFHLSQSGCMDLALAVRDHLHAEQLRLNEAHVREEMAKVRSLRELASSRREEAAKTTRPEERARLYAMAGEIDSEANMLFRRRFLRKEATLFAYDSTFEAPTTEEIAELMKDSAWESDEAIFNDPLMDALRRGVACHHAAMGTRYRLAVEMLFRRRKLRVVFATGTLAQGIHMPCRTVVIAGDSPFLHSLSFAQMTGRAGRRGLDTRGHVLLLNLSREKIAQVMASDFPAIVGNRILTVATVLRLVTRHFHGIKEERLEATAGELRRLVYGSVVASQHPSSYPPIAQRYVAYALDSLRRRQILDSDTLAPFPIAGLVTHLHYLEPGCILFAVLLNDESFLALMDEHAGAIARGAREAKFAGVRLAYEHVPREAIELVMGALSTIIAVVPLRRAQLAALARRPPGTFLSHVALRPDEDLPPAFCAAARAYNADTLGLLMRHLHSHVTRNARADTGDIAEAPDGELWRRLPLSCAASGAAGVEAVSSDGGIVGALRSSSRRVVLRSPYWAMRGFGDAFHGAEEFVLTSRTDLHAPLLHAPVFTTGAVNSYALDFLRHGQKQAIDRENLMADNIAYANIDDFRLGMTAASYALFKDVDAAVKHRVEGAHVDPSSLCVVGRADELLGDGVVDARLLRRLNIVRTLVAATRKFRDRTAEAYGRRS